MNETQLRELILKAISEAVGDTAGAQSAAPVPPASGAVESGVEYLGGDIETG